MLAVSYLCVMTGRDFPMLAVSYLCVMINIDFPMLAVSYLCVMINIADMICSVDSGLLWFISNKHVSSPRPGRESDFVNNSLKPGEKKQIEKRDQCNSQTNSSTSTQVGTRQFEMANTSPRHMPVLGNVHLIKIENIDIFRDVISLLARVFYIFNR